MIWIWIYNARQTCTFCIHTKLLAQIHFAFYSSYHTPALSLQGEFVQTLKIQVILKNNALEVQNEGFARNVSHRNIKRLHKVQVHQSNEQKLWMLNMSLHTQYEYVQQHINDCDYYGSRKTHTSSILFVTQCHTVELSVYWVWSYGVSNRDDDDGISS